MDGPLRFGKFGSPIDGQWRSCDECTRLGTHNIELNDTNGTVVGAYSGLEREFRDELRKRKLHLLESAMFGHLHESAILPQMIQEHLRVARFLQSIGGKYHAARGAASNHFQ